MDYNKQQVKGSVENLFKLSGQCLSHEYKNTGISEMQQRQIKWLDTHNTKRPIDRLTAVFYALVTP